MRNTTTSQNALCITCGKRWEDQATARKLGYAHAKTFKHDVIVEVVRAYSYEFSRRPNDRP